MRKLSTHFLLLAALILPVLLFLLLWSQMEGLLTIAIAIVAGWALNIAWAYARAADPSPPDGNTRAMAAYFGWICPTALVFLSWLALRVLA